MTLKQPSLSVSHLGHDDLQQHIQDLDIFSVAAYKLWCYRNGFSTDLHKTPEQRQAERDLFTHQQAPVDPDLSPYHNPRRAERIARIFQGEFQDDTLSDLLFRIRILYNNLEGDGEARKALCRLVLHVEKYADLLRPARAIKCYGHINTNTFIAALEQLARHHHDWMRPVESWRPDAVKSRVQFNALARHLLAKYHVPAFFDAAFLQGSTPDAQQQQTWFKHIGVGHNIRTANLPIRLTKRMAHLLLQDNGHHMTVYQAMRRVQYEAMGGMRNNSWAISRGPLGDRLENEAFWETVVQFLANEPFLERSYITPIIDYIRNQKYVPQRIARPDGTEIEGPPLHPSFCMKGRSINKLIRQVDMWHEELTGLEDVPFEKWKPSGFHEFTHELVNPEMKRNLQWTVQELTTSAQLHVEGRVMHHCVGSYTRRCASGDHSIWSIRALDLEAAEDTQEQMNVLTIAVENKKKAVTQHRGKYNLQPFGKKHLAKQRKTGNIYLHLLRQAPTILRLWMDREGLSLRSER